MITRGIRGAITINNNSEQAIKEATIELLKELFKINNINKDLISHIIFTTTKDVNAAFPAKFARLDFGLADTAMMCFHELDVPNSLPMCLRILIVLNCEDTFKPQFVYLRDAKNLRA